MKFLTIKLVNLNKLTNFTYHNRTEYRMGNNNFTFNHESDIPKYQQLVNSINDAIAIIVINLGSLWPSVNTICKTHSTVFKTYNLLKENESIPNKGCYVASDTRNFLLVFDIFKAYKEVLYHSFINNLQKTL